ncbi:MAG: DUF4397 domain-containing protein [Candidatus Pedobacter colombiensis]|uniref:DUF4397 domain-containing protein n=1 Tax=Candidatus Pedobacter colombiensis TaxID=3121371 RepID=A0AAJ6B6X1_9SPHI|nr:DUF4397 domain-containing protein [Pedobacter sp.]WEK17463.1 MAG: DUF4397 domain-containing protein [Pedobacter sp.]
MNISIQPTIKNFKRFSAFTLLSISSLFFNSCTKNAAPVPDTAFLSIMNTSPTLATFNIYVDQSKINAGGAVPFNGSTSYFQITPGSHSVKFTTGSSTESIITKDVTLEANTINSLFLIDRGTNMDFFKIKDELGSVSSTKAFVRFVNLSPDAPALDLAVKEGNVIIENKAYKANSQFIEVEAKTYVFEIRNKATGARLGEELSSMELKAGKSYTIISTGLVTPGQTEHGIQGKIITNQ